MRPEGVRLGRKSYASLKRIAPVAAEQAWELRFGEAAFAVLGEDVRRLKRVADERDSH